MSKEYSGAVLFAGGVNTPPPVAVLLRMQAPMQLQAELNALACPGNSPMRRQKCSYVYHPIECHSKQTQDYRMHARDLLVAALRKGTPFIIQLRNGWRYQVAAADQIAFPEHGDFAVFCDSEQNWHVVFQDTVAGIEHRA